MKVARVGVIAAAIFAVATMAWAQKPDFSGTWTLDPAAAGAPPAGGGGAPGGGGGGGGRGRGGILGMGPTTVKQSATDLTVESTSQDGTKSTRTYKLDGTESKNMVMGRGGQQMEAVSVAKFDGQKLTIVTKQTMGDQAVETTEVWTVDGSTLNVESTNARGTTKRVYKK
jgi:hypothetical protein